MSFTTIIPIINNIDCTDSYVVQYKKSTDTVWADLENPPIDNTITLHGLEDCSTYNVRALKKCCNNTYSLESNIDIPTGGNC